jgi:hypothetical protein
MRTFASAVCDSHDVDDQIWRLEARNASQEAGCSDGKSPEWVGVFCRSATVRVAVMDEIDSESGILRCLLVHDA